MHGLCRARPPSPPGEIGTTLEPRARWPLTTKAALGTALGVLVGLLQGFLQPYAMVGLDSGGGIRTRDLRVMSPTSYQTAAPRGRRRIIAIRRDAGEGGGQ